MNEEQCAPSFQMSQRIITGIDIGSHSVRAVITEYAPGSGLPRIFGM